MMTEKQNNAKLVAARHAILEAQHDSEALREASAIGYGRFLGSGPLNRGKRKASCSIPGKR